MLPSPSTAGNGPARPATVYAVQGMTCAHCERAVIEEVAAVAGVSAVRADAAAGTVTVTAAGEIDEAALGAAVAEAGYVLAGRASASPVTGPATGREAR